MTTDTYLHKSSRIKHNYICIYIRYFIRFRNDTCSVFPAPVRPQGGGSRTRTATTTTSKTVRLFGDAYIHFPFSQYSIQYPRMRQIVRNETFSLSFTTQQANGMIWLDQRADTLMYLALRVNIHCVLTGFP